jgi:hypothetical protein
MGEGAYVILIFKLPQSIFSHSPLRSEAGNGPKADFLPTVELLASHIPHALHRNGLRFGL